MHDNVWEWCEDVWHENYEGAPTDGSVWGDDGRRDYRVLRGEDIRFLHSKDHPPRVVYVCRVYRYGELRHLRPSGGGFRVVMSLSTPGSERATE